MHVARPWRTELKCAKTVHETVGLQRQAYPPRHGPIVWTRALVIAGGVGAIYGLLALEAVSPFILALAWRVPLKARAITASRGRLCYWIQHRLGRRDGALARELQAPFLPSDGCYD